ncbi:hypothetical protein [Luteimonas sp. 100069]|uniref:hypothetical protein n=1 Tax=Luteimonas sp. 100069 TaxID=2006109 RepID=UPI000F5144AB|nr:hypothetical protein [Luteimonas sp. 100069]
MSVRTYRGNVMEAVMRHAAFWGLVAAMLVGCGDHGAPQEREAGEDPAAVDSRPDVAAPNPVHARGEAPTQPTAPEGTVVVRHLPSTDLLAVPGDSSERSPGSASERAEPFARPADASQASAPAESRFLRNGRLRAEAMGVFQDGPAWAKLARDFENDGLSDPDARDLHLLFGDWLTTTLGRHGLEFADFGCGRSLCLATIPLSGPDAQAAYQRWSRQERKASPMPLPVFVESPFTWPDGRTEMRMMFSTDPHSAAIGTP